MMPVPSAPIPQAWTLFAHHYIGHKGDPFWFHLSTSRSFTALHGSQPVHEVEAVVLTEEEPDCYWAWFEFDRADLSLVYPSRPLLLMCSPDYFQRAMERGEGTILMLRVTPHARSITPP